MMPDQHVSSSASAGRRAPRQVTAEAAQQTGRRNRSPADIAGRPFGARLERYAQLAGDLPESIALLFKTRRTFEPGMHLLYQGEPGGRAFIIDKGWSFSSCTQASGSRQVLDIQLPGDVSGLLSLALPFSPHDVTAITRIDAFEVNSGQINEAIAGDRELYGLLLWLAASDGAVAAERLTDLGRRSALQRTAHFILELAARLRLAGLGSEFGFSCPMTQYIFADTLGLTSVHVNRIFRELRQTGLASHTRGWVSLLDGKRLAEIAMFDSAYLDHTSQLSG